MSPLDAIALVLLIGFIIRGIWVGFIRQVASMLALILAFLLAGYFAGDAAQLITPVIDNNQLCFLIAYALIFCLVFIGIIFIGIAGKKVAQVVLHDWFDKTMGGILGAAKGFFLACIAFMAMAIFISGASPIFTKSLFYPYLLKTSTILLSVVKDADVRDRLLPKQPAIANLLSHTIELGQELGRQAKQKASNY